MQQLTQGATPEKLSQSLSAGVLIACFPIFGCTTLLAAIIGYIFKLNHIVVQATHYMLYPVQFLMIPVYIKLVNQLTDIGDVPMHPEQIMQAFKQNWLECLKRYAHVGLYAVVIWFIFSSVLYLALAKLFLPAIKRLSKLKGG